MNQRIPFIILAIFACFCAGCMTSKGNAFKNTIDADEKKPPEHRDPRDIVTPEPSDAYTPDPPTDQSTPAPVQPDAIDYIGLSDLHDNQSMYSGSSGLMFCQRALSIRKNGLQLSAMMIAHMENIGNEVFIRAPSALFYRRGLSDDLEADLMGGFVFTNYYSAPIIVSGSLKYKYMDLGEEFCLRGALSTKATIHVGTGTDTYGNWSGLFLGFPLETDFSFLTIVVCPEIAFSPWRITGTPEWYATAGPFSWLYLRAGLILEIFDFTLCTSAVVRTFPLNHGFGFDIPIRAGTELNFFIPNTIFILHAIATLDYENPESFFVSCGLGLSIQSKD